MIEIAAIFRFSITRIKLFTPGLSSFFKHFLLYLNLEFSFSELNCNDFNLERPELFCLVMSVISVISVMTVISVMLALLVMSALPVMSII